MNVYSYILASDTGFAPNPFWGYCTLACCKPMIRRTASVGNWIVGLTPKHLGRRIAYAMKVSEKITMANYWRDKRFQEKRPKMRQKNVVYRCGDNIYKPMLGGKFHQKPSMHSNKDGSENPQQKKKDLGGEYVLVSNKFSYFGAKAEGLSDEFSAIIPGRGHRRFKYDNTVLDTGDGRMIGNLIKHLEKLPRGIHGNPRIWPDNDKSWKGEGVSYCR